MKTILSIFMLGILSLSVLSAKETKTIEIFFKNKPPSIKTLSKVLPMVNKYSKEYKIYLNEIYSPESADIIKAYGLPTTHFPFAVVINGKFTAKIDGKEIGFVHFPKFMNGIGRHEGNWSLEMLEAAIKNPKLLANENKLPAIEEHDDHDGNEHGGCEE